MFVRTEPSARLARRFVLPATLVLAAALVLVACESDDSSSPARDTPSSAQDTTAGADSGADTAPDTLSDVAAPRDVETADTRGDATEETTDAAPPPDGGGTDTVADVAPAPDGGDDTAADTTPDAEADTTTGPPVFPPFVPGPPPETYDCRATASPPDRRSPVPIDCPLDPECRQPMVVGHRGIGGEFAAIAPENSLQAIRAALELGVDGVELDVRDTADDGLVLMHDGTVDRTTGGTGSVGAMTTEEVTALALLPPAHPTRSVGGDFSCAHVPTLAEAFALTRGRLFVDLDMKTDRVDLVVAAIREADVVDEVFVSVKDADRALAARALAPEIRVQVRPDTREEYEAAIAAFETLETDPRPPEVIEIETNTIEDLAPDIHAAGLTVFTNGFEKDVAAYVTGNGDGYRELYDVGVDIIQSEYPPLVLDALDR